MKHLGSLESKCIITETCCKRMLQETPCYESHTQALFLICDRKHNEISPVRNVTRFKNVPLSAEWTINYSSSFIASKTSRQSMRGNHALKYTRHINPPSSLIFRNGKTEKLNFTLTFSDTKTLVYSLFSWTFFYSFPWCANAAFSKCFPTELLTVNAMKTWCFSIVFLPRKR